MARKVLDFLGKGVPEIARTRLLNNKAWIGGQWVDSSTGKTFPVINPATQDIITNVLDCISY